MAANRSARAGQSHGDPHLPARESPRLSTASDSAVWVQRRRVRSVGGEGRAGLRVGSHEQDGLAHTDHTTAADARACALPGHSRPWPWGDEHVTYVCWWLFLVIRVIYQWILLNWMHYLLYKQLLLIELIIGYVSICCCNGPCVYAIQEFTASCRYSISFSKYILNLWFIF